MSHPVDGCKLADGFRLKPGMQVKPCKAWSGRAENQSISDFLCERGGWRLVESGEDQSGSLSTTARYDPSKAQMMEKFGSNGQKLQRVLTTIGHRNNAGYDSGYRVVDRDGGVLLDLPKSDWADWDGGDLVFARDGCLYRILKGQFRAYADPHEDVFQRLYDFNDARFAAVAPTRDALQY